MRDHLLGHRGAALAVSCVLDDDQFETLTDAYPCGIPRRICAELTASVPGFDAEMAKRRANRDFRRGNHANPDGSVTACPPKTAKSSPATVAGFVHVHRTAPGNLCGTRVQEQAAAALAVPLKASTAAQAADRMGEAFAHAAAARGEG